MCSPCAAARHCGRQLKCHWARGPATPCLVRYWLRSGSNDRVTRPTENVNGQLSKRCHFNQVFFSRSSYYNDSKSFCYQGYSTRFPQDPVSSATVQQWKWHLGGQQAVLCFQPGPLLFRKKLADIHCYMEHGFKKYPSMEILMDDYTKYCGLATIT